jgi:hypothetical protein
MSRKGKSVQEVSKHHGRTDVRYSQPKVFKPWYTRNGERREVDHYAVKIQYRGRRENISLTWERRIGRQRRGARGISTSLSCKATGQQLWRG